MKFEDNMKIFDLFLEYDEIDEAFMPIGKMVRKPVQMVGKTIRKVGRTMMGRSVKTGARLKKSPGMMQRMKNAAAQTKKGLRTAGKQLKKNYSTMKPTTSIQR